MHFDFKVIAKSFPTICLVLGVFLLVGYWVFGFGSGAAVWGGILIFAAIGLYVWRYRQ
jgi:hypothetical protein